MIIKTINPITISGKRISKPSEYLSADGDFYDADGDYNDEFYGFDANGKPVKSNKTEVKQFQTFANTKGESLVVDGLWGAKSETAWGKWGTDFAKSIGLGGGSGATTQSSTPNVSVPASTIVPTKEEQIEQAKKGKIWDKAKGWITSDKAKDVLRSLLEGGGFMGAINSLFGAGSTSAEATPSGTMPSGETPSGTKPGMSRNLKIGIAVGAIALLGIIIYSATRPKATN
jgi:hypothetical protein